MLDSNGVAVYPWNHGETLTAAALNAAIAQSAAASAGTANVMAFGAIGNGTTVDTAAIQAAAASLTNGGILLFPAQLSFLLDATILLNSNTTVMAYGATLLGTAAWNNPVVPPSPEGFGLGQSFFTNRNWNVTSQTDHDIAIYGGVWIPGVASVQRHGCGGFHLVSDMEVAFVTVLGAASSFTFVTCSRINCHDCKFVNISGSAFNFWSGFSDVMVRNNYISRDPSNPGAVPSLEFTGSTSLNTEAHSTNFVCEGNQVYGGLANIYAIQVDETDTLSTVSNGIICNNQIDLTGFPGAGGIGAYGGSDNINIHHNTVKGVSDYNCINVFPNTYGQPKRAHVDNNRILDSTRTSGGATLLSVNGNDSTVLDNDIINCTCTNPISVSGANVVVRSGRMDSGSGGSRGVVTGTNSFFDDYNIATGVKSTSAVVNSAAGFSIGSGSTIDSYLAAQTFTPTLQFGGANVGITYSTQAGTYIRIGKLIYYTVAITLTSKGTSTGNVGILLPFSQTGALQAPCTTIGFANLVSVSSPPFVWLVSNVAQPLTAVGGTHLTDANFGNTSSLNFAGLCTVP